MPLYLMIELKGKLTTEKYVSYLILFAAKEAKTYLRNQYVNGFIKIDLYLQ
jgi:hypothetical protein